MIQNEGKTINQLLRISTVTGAELIPLSVYDDVRLAYVTRAVTIDDFLRILAARVQVVEERSAYNAIAIEELDNTMTYEISYIADGLSDEINKTNTYVSYNAEGIVKVHNEVRDHWAYVTGVVKPGLDDVTAYASYLGYMIDNDNVEISTLKDKDELHDHRLDNIDNDLSYVHSYINSINIEQEEQNRRISDNEEGIHVLAAALSYQSTVNNIQSGYINTVYYEHKEDAFDDWSKEGDEDVKPQI